MSDIQKTRKNSHVVYPSGKPMIPHLLRCQGIGVNYYSLTSAVFDPELRPKGAQSMPTLDAWHLQHPRLLQR